MPRSISSRTDASSISLSNQSHAERYSARANIAATSIVGDLVKLLLSSTHMIALAARVSDGDHVPLRGFYLHR